MFDNKAQYMTYIASRQRPLMFANTITNVKKVIESNQGYKRDISIWERSDQTMNLVYLGSFYIDEIEDVKTFVYGLENK